MGGAAGALLSFLPFSPLSRNRGSKMTRPVRRVKTYSGESGTVYQYVFLDQRRARRGLFRSGTEYVFDVSADRKTSFPLVVFIEDAALKAWAREHGRELSSTEQYAAAKMRLFRAFDGEPLDQTSQVSVDASSLGELLEALGIT